jgi:histidinol dehydrogenase
MPTRFEASSPDFATQLNDFVAARREIGDDLAPAVKAIIAEVRAKGDVALFAYTQQWDRLTLTKNTLKVTAAEIEAAIKAVPEDVQAALEIAAKRITTYHQKQIPADCDYVDETGVALGWRWHAVDAAGLYVPGGKAAYPSSVLMNAIPAKVAGVKRLATVVPAPDGVLNPVILAAAQIAGVDEIYRIGGAQAVAALAYGTESIAPVDIIVGPGNAYVAEAKRQVFGQVGIDMIAGPSEICVVADSKNNPAWIAADLLSQAEHDELAQSVLITNDGAFAAAVEKDIQRLLGELPRGNIAGASWEKYGSVILVKDWEQAASIVNRLAPEHLELAVDAPDKLAGRITHAGAIFLGRHTPEAFGDYLAGPSHVLPTSGTARFSSGLSVLSFMKRTSLTNASAAAIKSVGEAAATLADAEGLQAHALSVRERLK